jgi:hypothetical protein
MAKVPIHFIGFLANVDHSVTGLRMGEWFAIEQKSKNDVAPFLREIDKYHEYYGLQTAFSILSGSYYCILRTDIAQFEATPEGGVAMRPKVLDDAHKRVQDKCRLLRLFKEGNIVLVCSFVYHLADTDAEARPFASKIREYPVVDTTQFALTPSEISEAESFLKRTSFPLPNEALQLALGSLDKSYETDDVGLAFLSLMIAMEVMLNPSDRELRYRISRNAGVLLGQSRTEGETIYREMKKLYDKRWGLVHTGDKSVVTREDVLALRRYVRETIKEGMESGMSKEALLNILTACGFGERPWREGR